MRDVMREFEVAEFWDAGFSENPTRTYREMLEEIRSRGIKFKAVRRGETRAIGQAVLEVLNPGPQFSSENPNDASIVVRLAYGSKSFLFTGDSEITPPRGKSSAWQEMLETQRGKLRADVLKAAHHGSSDGTTLDIIEAVRPSLVTISCEAGNEYHHPHPRVVDLLERNQGTIKVFRTDLQGTITAVCDGQSIEVSTEKQVTEDRLYLTGDEVAGKVASGGKNNGEEERGMTRSKRAKRSR
jgi:competence protein ComEC